MGAIIDFLSTDKRRASIDAFIRNAASNGTTEIHVEQICSALQLDYQKTAKDLEAMIKLSYQYKTLNKAYIDISRKALVLSVKRDGSITDKLKSMVDDASGALLGQKFFGQKNEESKNATLATKCQNCGAPIDGRISECEYCGSPLK